MLHNTLNIKTAVVYVPYQDLENKNMMLGLLERPDDFVQHLRRYTSSLTTQVVYGFRTTSTEDPRMLQFFRVNSSAVSPVARPWFMLTGFLGV